MNNYVAALTPSSREGTDGRYNKNRQPEPHSEKGDKEGFAGKDAAPVGLGIGIDIPDPRRYRSLLPSGNHLHRS